MKVSEIFKGEKFPDPGVAYQALCAAHSQSSPPVRLFLQSPVLVRCPPPWNAGIARVGLAALPLQEQLSQAPPGTLVLL